MVFWLKANKFFCLYILDKDLVLNIKAESSSTTLACKAQNPEIIALISASPMGYNAIDSLKALPAPYTGMALPHSVSMGEHIPRNLFTEKEHALI